METVNEKQQVLYTALKFMDRPPISYLDSEKLLPIKSLVLLVGQPGTAKSLWALKLAVEISRNRTVVVVLGEGQAGYPERLRAAQQVYQIMNEHLHIYDEPVNLKDEEEVSDFIALIKQYKIRPRLFIFDTLSTCSAGADENRVVDMTRVMESCKELQNTFEATVLLIHHSTKNGETYRGSSVLHGVIDAMYFASAKSGKKFSSPAKR
jgi:predicted ATP-dependent serine protease